MVKHIFIFFAGCLIGMPSLFGQMVMVQGVVVNARGNLLYGAEVSDINKNHIQYSGPMGEFSIELPCQDSCELTFYSTGYSIKNVVVKPGQFVTVIMEENESYAAGRQAAQPNSRTKKVGVLLQAGFDIYDLNYDSFIPQLGTTNVEYLNKPTGVMVFKLGFDVKRVYFSFDWGFSGSFAPEDEDKQDSIAYETNQTHYGLHLGYHIIQTKRFLLTPDIGLKWYKARLINSYRENKIELDQYLETGSLDIRFNQLTWFVGVNVQYLTFSKEDPNGNSWTLGGYIGYLSKVNTIPWVNSVRNRLKTDHSLQVGSLNWGITFGMYF